MGIVELSPEVCSSHNDADTASKAFCTNLKNVTIGTPQWKTLVKEFGTKELEKAERAFFPPSKDPFLIAEEKLVKTHARLHNVPLPPPPPRNLIDFFLSDIAALRVQSLAEEALRYRIDSEDFKLCHRRLVSVIKGSGLSGDFDVLAVKAIRRARIATGVPLLLEDNKSLFEKIFTLLLSYPHLNPQLNNLFGAITPIASFLLGLQTEDSSKLLASSPGSGTIISANPQKALALAHGILKLSESIHTRLAQAPRVGPRFAKETQLDELLSSLDAFAQATITAKGRIPLEDIKRILFALNSVANKVADQIPIRRYFDTVEFRNAIARAKRIGMYEIHDTLKLAVGEIFGKTWQ